LNAGQRRKQDLFLPEDYKIANRGQSTGGKREKDSENAEEKK